VQQELTLGVQRRSAIGTPEEVTKLPAISLRRGVVGEEIPMVFLKLVANGFLD